MRGRGLGSCGLGYGSVGGCCEKGNATSGPLKFGELLDRLSN